jgi:hypothetical protein
VSAQIISIGGESLLEFIKREGGVTNTGNVANRFGWTMAEARKQLRALVAAGELLPPVMKHHPCAGVGGGILEWRSAA